MEKIVLFFVKLLNKNLFLDNNDFQGGMFMLHDYEIKEMNQTI